MPRKKIAAYTVGPTDRNSMNNNSFRSRNFLQFRYSLLTVFIWQNLNLSACSHRRMMILAYFETIFHTEFSQGY